MLISLSWVTLFKKWSNKCLQKLKDWDSGVRKKIRGTKFGVSCVINFYQNEHPVYVWIIFSLFLAMFKNIYNFSVEKNFKN